MYGSNAAFAGGASGVGIAALSTANTLLLVIAAFFIAGSTIALLRRSPAIRP